MQTSEPFYRRHIFFCTNERPPDNPKGCCKAKNSERLLNYMKAKIKEIGIEKIRVNKSGCLDRCALGPVLVIYPEGVWYTCSSFVDADEIIATHLQKGEIVSRLMLKNDQAELTAEQKKAC